MMKETFMGFFFGTVFSDGKGSGHRSVCGRDKSFTADT